MITLRREMVPYSNLHPLYQTKSKAHSKYLRNVYWMNEFTFSSFSLLTPSLDGRDFASLTISLFSKCLSYWCLSKAGLIFIFYKTSLSFPGGSNHGFLWAPLLLVSVSVVEFICVNHCTLLTVMSPWYTVNSWREGTILFNFVYSAQSLAKKMHSVNVCEGMIERLSE